MKNLKVTKYDELNSFAQLLKDNGFDIISSYDPDNNSFNSYFHFHKGGYFGYVQNQGLEGYSLSTENKPCNEYGTGHRYKTGWDILTIENAQECLNFCKRLIDSKEEINNYPSIEAFLKSSLHSNCKLISPSK